MLVPGGISVVVIGDNGGTGATGPGGVGAGVVVVVPVTSTVDTGLVVPAGGVVTVEPSA